MIFKLNIQKIRHSGGLCLNAYAFTSMMLSCVGEYSVSVQITSVIRATASSLSPSMGAGTATVTFSAPM